MFITQPFPAQDHHHSMISQHQWWFLKMINYIAAIMVNMSWLSALSALMKPKRKTTELVAYTQLMIWWWHNDQLMTPQKQVNIRNWRKDLQELKSIIGIIQRKLYENLIRFSFNHIWIGNGLISDIEKSFLSR